MIRLKIALLRYFVSIRIILISVSIIYTVVIYITIIILISVTIIQSVVIYTVTSAAAGNKNQSCKNSKKHKEFFHFFLLYAESLYRFKQKVVDLPAVCDLFLFPLGFYGSVVTAVGKTLEKCAGEGDLFLHKFGIFGMVSRDKEFSPFFEAVPEHNEVFEADSSEFVVLFLGPRIGKVDVDRVKRCERDKFAHYGDRFEADDADVILIESSFQILFAAEKEFAAVFNP